MIIALARHLSVALVTSDEKIRAYKHVKTIEQPKMSKPFLILQLRPEDDTSDNEFTAILKYGRLEEKAVHRLRIEKNGIPDDLSLSDYCAVIVGGSPFDLSTPEEDKSAIQKKIESDFNRLFGRRKATTTIESSLWSNRHG